MADEATPSQEAGGQAGRDPEEAAELTEELRRDLDAVREHEDPLSLGDPAQGEIVRQVGESGGPRGL